MLNAHNRIFQSTEIFKILNITQLFALKQNEIHEILKIKSSGRANA